MKHHASVLLSHHGSDATPEYSLRHPDPALPASKNRYAVALYDSYNPDVLFGEVLLIPEWAQATLSQEEIRQNGGIPPPPQPILPTEFTIQLYNPDQQVVVQSHPGTWNSAPYWGFEMPQQSFRQPSVSSLDRTKSDPAASETTPKISFKWRKDGKLSKDYICALASKSSNLDSNKRKNKEPDITVAMFRQLREITIYEPNLSRVDMEDPKGLEVVVLLGAIVIREVYNNPLKNVFNLADIPRRNSNELSSRKNSKSKSAPVAQSPSRIPLAAQISNQEQQNSPPGLRLQPQLSNHEPPPMDPRTQWEHDVETARLKKQVEHEERERRRAELAETKRVKKMVEAEEREARRKQTEVDKETERLRRLYGAEQSSEPIRRPTLSSSQSRPQQYSAPTLQTLYSRPHSAAALSSTPAPRPLASSEPYSQVSSDTHVASGFFGGTPQLNGEGKKIKFKKSFFGMRSASDGQAQKLSKKQSTVW